MLKEKAEAYYLQGYNCAECIIRAANDVYQLDLDEAALRMSAGFGAGMQVGDVCGALSGSICVISSRYVETKAHDCTALRPLCQKMVIAFQKRFSSRQCAKIKPMFFSKETRCLNTVSTAAQVLEEVLQEWDADQELL